MIDSICPFYGTIGIERLNGYTKREFTFGVQWLQANGVGMTSS